MNNYLRLAEDIMFGPERGVDAMLQKHKLEYRKGKCFSHIKNSVNKAFKSGMGKTECELSLLECYLRGVLKDKKP